MLAMAQINYIKYATDIEGKNYSQVAREMGVDRRTVKKYADKEDFSPKITSRKRKAPVMDPVKPLIDKWLQEDQKRPKKQRHTAVRIHERLVEEHDFKGSYSSVKLYVRQKKKKLYKNNKAAMPLKHPGGEAQADFGQVYVIYQGTKRKAHYLILSFPFSNAAFVQLHWGENQECLIQGLIDIFQEINNVPAKIWFDNLSAAVTKINTDGSRNFTESFRKFAAHYRFKPVFYNPNRGNEKGNVENKVGYIRKNWFVPLPKFDNLEVFNRKLLKKSWEDIDRKHYEKNILIKKLFNIEKKLLQLPSKPYDNFRLISLKTNKYGYVRVDNNLYTSSPEVAGKGVWAKIKYNEIEILDNNYKHIVTHDRLYARGDKSEKWLPYLSFLTKRPKAIKYTDFYQKLPETWQEYINQSNDSSKALGKIYSFLKREYSTKDAIELLELEKLYGEPDNILDYPHYSEKDSFSQYNRLFNRKEVVDNE